jgi:hypothetical protein
VGALAPSLGASTTGLKALTTRFEALTTSLGVPITSHGVPMTCLGASRSDVQQSGLNNKDFGNAAGTPGILSYYLLFNNF